MQLFYFTIRNYKTQAILAILIFGGIFILSTKFSKFHNDISWIDPVLGFGILLFTIYLWLNGIRSEWENSLEKRLNALFMFEGETVLEFKAIRLLHEGDARAWAQQVARQKTGQKDLDFEPFFKFSDLGVVKPDNKGRAIKCYEIIIYFTKLPDYIQKEKSNQYPLPIVWSQIEQEDGQIKMERQNIQPKPYA